MLTEYHRILYLAAFLAVIYILVPLPISSVSRNLTLFATNVLADNGLHSDGLT